MKKPDLEFFTAIQDEDWAKLQEVFNNCSEAEVPAALDALFAAGTPLNGARFAGDQATSIMDLAWWLDSTAGVLYMFDKLPDVLSRYDNPLVYFGCFPRMIQKLLEDGVAAQYLSDPNLIGTMRLDGKPELIDTLARAGMRLDVQLKIDSHLERTAPAVLLVAAERDASVLEVFASNGADLALRDYLGNTLIHCVTQGVVGKGRRADAKPDEMNSFSRKIQLALAAGVDIDAKNSQGDTALHLAVRHGFGKKAKVLLECGASLQATTVDGKTAADLGRTSRKPGLRSIMQVALAQSAVQAIIRNIGR